MPKPRIVIVEDDQEVASHLRSALDDECDVSLRGRELAATAPGQESLITLLDLESPSKPHPEEGVRLLEQWRRAGFRGKVIVYTGSPARNVAVQAVRHGAMEVLSKPLDLALLKGIVCRAARMADLEQEAQAGLPEGGLACFQGMVVMAESTHVRPPDLDISPPALGQEDGSISLKINQQRIETGLIMKAFTLSQGNMSRAAHELGISRSTLYRRLRQYGMDRSPDARRTLGESPRV